jgi:hypothetical protein
MGLLGLALTVLPIDMGVVAVSREPFGMLRRE